MGSFRFRKSYKIAPGVRFNVNKKSVGVSVGGKHIRRSFNTSGRKTTSVGIPGTGLYYMDTNVSRSSPKKVRAVKAKAVQQQSPSTYVERQKPRKTKKAKTDGLSKLIIAMLVLAIGVVLALIIALIWGDSDYLNETESSTIVSTTIQSNDRRQSPLGEMIVVNGNTSSTLNGVIRSDEGHWYFVKNGLIQTDYTGVQTNNYGAWYIKDGKVNFDYSGEAISEGNVYMISNGKVDTSVNGVIKAAGNWVYFNKGMVDPYYTGVSTNEYGTWYVKNGRVQFDYNGTITANGRDYSVTGGKAKLQTIRHTSVAVTTSGTTQFVDRGAYDEVENPDGYMDMPITGYAYVGNSKTHKYHKQGCRYIPMISLENAVCNNDRQFFVYEGYVPCDVCNP